MDTLDNLQKVISNQWRTIDDLIIYIIIIDHLFLKVESESLVIVTQFLTHHHSQQKAAIGLLGNADQSECSVEPII